MAFRELFLLSLVVAYSTAQTYKVCVSSTKTALCQSMDREGQAVCATVESSVDCALQLSRGAIDFGVFTEEEILLLAQQQPNDNRVVATIRDVNHDAPYAFEAVAVVPTSHVNGFEGLRGGKYCHPGIDVTEVRWSNRVLKTLERLAASTDRCPGVNPQWKTAEEVEIETLNGFFSAACRPGKWSANTTVDASLKSRYSNLCSLCGETNSTCNGYTINMGVEVSGASNSNRHIQALECLRRNGNGSVALAAWQHVREFFNIRNPELATSFALLCEDGTVRPLTSEVLSNVTSPCALIRQPWGAIVASTAQASAVQASIRTWWPAGTNPGGSTWQSTVFSGIIGGSNPRVVYADTILSPANFTSSIRTISSIDATTSCVPVARWCTLSTAEHTKCTWVRSAAYTLGIQPIISCQQRSSIFECLRDIRDDRADFIASDSNYGYLARQHYNLSPVKLVQNSRSYATSFSRVAALVKNSAAETNITRFENLRGKVACFPEFGGIAFVAFVRTAHERGIISASECDYTRAVGEFFGGACAPGAVDASHALSQSPFNASELCTSCRVSSTNNSFTCAWDYANNMYFGNNGSVACIADPATDVAFLQTQNLAAQMAALNVNASNYRVLCRNNTLAAFSGINIDDNCLLAYVVDAEVVTRRNDPRTNSLNTLLDTLDAQFGYNAGSAQLINLEIYSSFDNIAHLLFKNSAIGLTEPSSSTANEPARNYNELFQHLEDCTSSATPIPGLASRSIYSAVTLLIMSLMTRFVMY